MERSGRPIDKRRLFDLSVSIAILIWAGICCFQFLSVDSNIPPYRGVESNTTPYWYTYISFFNVLPVLSFQLPDSFITNFVCETVSLILHGVIGVLFLRLFIRLPRVTELVAGVFVGIGLATFVLELFAIFFLLNRFTILLTLAALCLLLVLLKKRWDWCAEEESAPAESFQTPVHTILYWCAWGVLVFLTILSFYHALLFPVDYWDALILYTHYGKITYQQGGFPVLVCLQVGLGLGANYPHLFPLHQAVTATLFGHWSDLYGQLLPPLAGLGSIVVIYCLVLRLFRNRLAAVLAVLSFRCVPYVSTYFVWVSDYSLVMLYTCLFLLFMTIFFERPSCRAFQPLIAVAAIFPHINYLGWIVWPCLIVALGWAFYANSTDKTQWIRAVLTVLFWFGLGLTWYVRNWIVTGNPVYAFFPEIFGGRNINLDVLESCNREWLNHGFGAAQLGSTLWWKIRNSFWIFLYDWRFAPVCLGIFFPAFFLGWRKDQKLFFTGGLLLLLLFIYQYVISGLYWYHTIAVFPVLGIFAGRFLAQIQQRIVLPLFGIALLSMASVSGVSFSLMGPKIPDPSLSLFSHSGISAENYYRLKYPPESKAWQYLNQNAEEKSVVLTHDNRYHVYRDDIQIIHLDDCGLIPLYGQPYPKIHKRLLEMGMQYYLFIPDEKSHPITARLGHLSYLDDQQFYQQILQSGEVQLFRLMAGE